MPARPGVGDLGRLDRPRVCSTRAVSEATGGSPAPGRRGRRLRAALVVSYLSAGWSTFGGSMSVVAGIAAHSTALVGTGADALADLLSTVVLIWRFRKERASHPAPDRLERRAQVVSSTCLLVVGGGLLLGGGLRLAAGTGARPTSLSLGLAAASVAVLPGLSWRKYRVAGRLASRALRTDAHIGMIGATTAACTLAGLAATDLGYPAADPIAGLVVGVLAAGTGARGLLGGRT